MQKNTLLNDASYIILEGSFYLVYLLPISVFSTVLSYGRHSRMKIPYERMSIIRNFEQRHRNNPRLEVEAGAEYSDVGGKK